MGGGGAVMSFIAMVDEEDEQLDVGILRFSQRSVRKSWIAIGFSDLLPVAAAHLPLSAIVGASLEDEKKQAKALKVACNLNNAASKLKLKEYKEAEKLCTKVLDLENTNVKALYRRAQAYIHLADLDLAEFDIKKALEIDPDNRYAL
ncbi:hypothetical protein RIF29_26887 [Crotalaria pallida]|uniref:Uncharacterized protein n=1 Tax=Crotalaria pallida TaxID=3830 RepID=A0AAN9ET62_CROPI